MTASPTWMVSISSLSQSRREAICPGPNARAVSYSDLIPSGGWEAGGSSPTLALGLGPATTPGPILAGSWRSGPHSSTGRAGPAPLCPPRLVRTRLFHRSPSHPALSTSSPPLTPHQCLDKDSVLRVRTGSVLPLRLIDLHEDVLPMLWSRPCLAGCVGSWHQR